MRQVIFLFGEAEKGEFCTPLIYNSLPQLAEELGNPPQDSKGILYAVQTLMYERELIFFRVKEEGFSTEDYMRGINLLKSKDSFSPLSAICMPGVGSGKIIDATSPVCSLHHSCLIIDEKDLYDYLTSLPPR